MKPALAVLILISSACISKAQAINPLKGLHRVSIVIENIGKEGQDIHLDKQDLQSQTLVALRRDIPTLKINSESTPYVYVNIVGARSSGGGYAFFVHVGVCRPALILDDDANVVMKAIPEVWDSGIILTGDPDTMAGRIRQVVSDKITEFAADYYKQNPN
jgi:hypothetical protein